jgi:rRNA-processing protein Efg1
MPNKNWLNGTRPFGFSVFPFLGGNQCLYRERQKATRRLKQAKKTYAKTPSDENKLDVDKYTLDLYYTIHFPLTEPYISLYPKPGIQSEDVSEKRERIRNQLEGEMLKGKQTTSGSNKIELGVRKSATHSEKDAQLSDEESEDDSEQIAMEEKMSEENAMEESKEYIEED